MRARIPFACLMLLGASLPLHAADFACYLRFPTVAPAIALIETDTVANARACIYTDTDANTNTGTCCYANTNTGTCCYANTNTRCN